MNLEPLLLYKICDDFSKVNIQFVKALATVFLFLFNKDIAYAFLVNKFIIVKIYLNLLF